MYFFRGKVYEYHVELKLLKENQSKILSILIKDNEVYKHMKCIVYTFMYTLKYQNLFFKHKTVLVQINKTIKNKISS